MKKKKKKEEEEEEEERASCVFKIVRTQNYNFHSLGLRKSCILTKMVPGHSYGGQIKYQQTCLHILVSFQPVLHDWCNKDRGMRYPVCGMVHIKESLLLIGKSTPCGGSGFPLSLSEWSFTI